MAETVVAVPLPAGCTIRLGERNVSVANVTTMSLVADLEGRMLDVCRMDELEPVERRMISPALTEPAVVCLRAAADGEYVSPDGTRLISWETDAVLDWSAFCFTAEEHPELAPWETAMSATWPQTALHRSLHRFQVEASGRCYDVRSGKEVCAPSPPKERRMRVPLLTVPPFVCEIFHCRNYQ